MLVKSFAETCHLFGGWGGFTIILNVSNCGNMRETHILVTFFTINNCFGNHLENAVFYITVDNRSLHQLQTSKFHVSYIFHESAGCHNYLSYPILIFYQ